MGKYLIQDIIPPEKKHRTAATRSDGGAAKEGVHRIVHSEHPIRTPEIIHAGKQRAPSMNPRSMIVDQLTREDHAEAQEDGDREETPLAGTHQETDADSSKIKMWSPALNENGAPKSAPPVSDVPPRFPEYSSAQKSVPGRWLPWLLGVGVLLVAIFFVLNYFAGATVTIVAKHQSASLDGQFVALKGGTGAELPYAIMSTTTSLSVEVPATGEKTVTTKASGRIVVYNEQPAAQRLIKNTRFQTPGGKIYRINDSITIPKATIVGGKSMPGSLEVTVYADEAGPEYNSDPTDFTLPGLKGFPSFNKVYARSRGPLSGGASGMIKTVSDQDLKQAGEDLRVKLEAKLRGVGRGSLAPFQITYDEGIVVDLGEPSLAKASASASNKAVVTEEGRISIVFFKRADLTKAIVKKLVENYSGEEVDIKNLDLLQFTMNPQTGNALREGTKLNFALKGTPELTWIVDEKTIKEALVGVSKDSFVGILAQYPSVERAEASVRPMWKRSFPDIPAKISVLLVEQLPK